VDLTKFFKNKTVFITGHTGFKGSWLSIWLRELGARVVGFSLEQPPSNPNNFEASKLRGRIIDHRGDIRDFSALKTIFEKYSPQIVFHLAAQSLVRPSYDQPRETFEINVQGTVNILDLVRTSNSVEALINVTSDKCYQNQEWTWGYRENDPLGGKDPYSGSKACAEMVFNSYAHSFLNKNNKLGIASVRAGNVIGGGDWAQDRLVPDCIRALSSQQTIYLRSPHAIRPWQFVLEPLYGYILLAANLLKSSEKFSGAWNFGPDHDSCQRVEEIVAKVCNLWGKGEWQDISNPHEPKTEMKCLKLNSDKALCYLNWRSQLDIEQALEFTTHWYNKFYSKNQTDMYDFCKSQIEKYINIAGK